MQNASRQAGGQSAPNRRTQHQSDRRPVASNVTSDRALCALRDLSAAEISPASPTSVRHSCNLTRCHGSLQDFWSFVARPLHISSLKKLVGLGLSQSGPKVCGLAMGMNMSHVGYSASSPIARRAERPYSPRPVLATTESWRAETLIYAVLLASVVFSVLWVS